MGSPVLEVRGLSKTYGATVAADDVSFEVRAGEIFGLLGPNGAGKTTTLECIEGLRKPDAGTVSVRTQRDGLQAIGVQLQTGSLPAMMTVAEAMRFFCAYHGVEQRDDLIERFGLGPKRRSRYADLSVGNQRRLALALAVAHRPDLLLLDEPTAGLDVASRTELHAIMRELTDGGTAVLLATHDMAEAEKMTDRIAILLGGRIVAHGTALEITASGSDVTKVTVSTERGALVASRPTLPSAELATVGDGYLVYRSTDSAATVMALLQAVEAAGDKLVDLRVERPSLEERFLEITSQVRPTTIGAGRPEGER